MDKNYYIFLDIDGTLWDSYSNPYLIACPTKLKQESINAVNTLIKGIKHKGYNPELVITSGIRSQWNTCKKTLYSNGITQEVPMNPLFVNEKYTRGEKIAIFLHDRHNGKKHSLQRETTIFDHFKTKFNQKVDNYVVIDDSIHKLPNIPKYNLIQTSMYKSALSNTMVTNFLEIVSPYKEDEPEL